MFSNRLKGYVYESMGKKKDAITSFETALQYNPNLFDERKKLRQLQGKKTIASYFEKENIYEEIDAFIAEPSTTDDNFEYIFYEESTALFEGGSSIDYVTLGLRMINESGVNYWKECNIGYNSSQALYIEVV